MLTLYSDKISRNCQSYSRRELLKIGTLGLGGLSLPQLLAEEAKGYVKDKTVVMLNMQGGPSQYETFDPKMDAPSEIRSVFGEVKTNIPGVRFGGHFKRLAKMADKMAVVRSYRHGISDHTKAAMHVAAGGNPTGACMGSLFSRVAGITNSLNGMPANTLIVPAAVETKDARKFNSVPSRIANTGNLSSVYGAFDPSSGGDLLDDMKLQVPQDRIMDQLSLSSSLDVLKRRLDSSSAIHQASSLQQQAIDVLMKGVGEAFDFSKEDSKIIERYDTSQFDVPKATVDKRKNKDAIRGHSPISLGKQMLLVRRLCESGCGFITVSSPGWDMHGAHEFAITDGMPVLGPAVDKAVSAFIEDIESRGLTEKVLLVITGEFGRTPKINAKGGRDHWGNLCPLVFVGGGLKMGQVIGESDKKGEEPITNPITSNDLLGTIMHSLFDLGQVRTLANIPRDVQDVVGSGNPISELI